MPPETGPHPAVPLPPSVTRIPAASFSYGSSSRHAAGPPHGALDVHRPRLNAQERNASGPLGAARKERSGKPIMDWIKKLGGGTRKALTGGGENVGHARGAQGQTRAAPATERWRSSAHAPPPANGMKLGPRPSSTHRISGSSSGQPIDLALRMPRSGVAPTFRTRSSASPMSSPAVSRSPSDISLAASFLGVEDPDDRSFVPSSPTNDEGASLRPIAPSHSSSPARSGFDSTHTPSRYRFRGAAHDRRSSTSTAGSSIHAPSEWRSFKSNGAHTNGSGTGSGTPSTKPTTVFSVESGAGGMAHIAQDVPHAQHAEAAAHTGQHAFPRPPSVYRTLTWESGFSGPSHPSPLAITSTAQDAQQDAPATPLVSSGPSMAQVPPPLASPIQNLRHSLVQAPKHSRPHPRTNPRPDAQPGPNASTLTLASSTFAFSPAPGIGSSGRARSIADSAGAGPARHADAEEENHAAGHGARNRMSGVDAPPELRVETDGSTAGSPLRDSIFRRQDHVGTLPTFDSSSLRDHPASARGASAYSTYSKHRALDDDASIRALRRRGSGESGTSKFSWAAVHSPWGGEAQGGVTLGQPVVQVAQ